VGFEEATRIMLLDLCLSMMFIHPSCDCLGDGIVDTISKIHVALIFFRRYCQNSLHSFCSLNDALQSQSHGLYCCRPFTPYVARLSILFPLLLSCRKQTKFPMREPR
jgi:hypothetical protein